jgi:hypothetical protein
VGGERSEGLSQGGLRRQGSQFKAKARSQGVRSQFTLFIKFYILMKRVSGKAKAGSQGVWSQFTLFIKFYILMKRVSGKARSQEVWSPQFQVRR